MESNGGMVTDVFEKNIDFSELKNWKKNEASKYKFASEFDEVLKNFYVPWEAVQKDGDKNTVHVFASHVYDRDKFIYINWVYDKHKVISKDIVSIEKSNLKKWLREARDSSMIDCDSLINIARFLYFED
jgi:hypothetical protein